MNRTQRRQAMRAQGWRGSKAKRQNLGQERPELAPEESPARRNLMAELKAPSAGQQLAEHQRRQEARRMGLVIPPTAAEAAILRANGVHAAAGGLLIPGR